MGGGGGRGWSENMAVGGKEEGRRRKTGREMAAFVLDTGSVLPSASPLSAISPDARSVSGQFPPSEPSVVLFCPLLCFLAEFFSSAFWLHTSGVCSRCS